MNNPKVPYWLRSVAGDTAFSLYNDVRLLASVWDDGRWQIHADLPQGAKAHGRAQDPQLARADIEGILNPILQFLGYLPIRAYREPRVDDPKLYRVKVSKSLMVLAPSHAEAQALGVRFANDEPNCTAHPKQIGSKWEVFETERKSLVWHEGLEDITVAEAIEMLPDTLLPTPVYQSMVEAQLTDDADEDEDDEDEDDEDEDDEDEDDEDEDDEDEDDED